MSGYAWDQLRRALASARDSPEPEVRRDAERRVESWVKVLTGMLSGRVRVGSRTPVEGFPVWLTPEIVRGGFATGSPAAGGPKEADELEWARLAGVKATRAGLFAWFLSDDGLALLERWLDSGAYRVELPEHGALLVVAHLLRTGHAAGAEDLLRTLEPWAGHIRFWPYTMHEPESPGVHVATVPEVAGRLARKSPQQQVEAEREALGVWAPFADRVVEHWWRTRTDDGVDTAHPSGWADGAAALLEEYGQLAARHRLTTKHADPKGNLQHLLAGFRERLADPSRPPIGRVRHAVASVVAKRGEPGSARLRELRAGQRERAGRPSHAALAREVAAALEKTGVTGAVPEPAALVDGLPGASLTSVARSLEKATSAPLEELLRRGIVRSAEMLAVLAPQLTADTVASRYPDQVPATLAKRIYRAFTNRRSVLLLHHQSQVTIDSIPWFTALEESAAAGGGEMLARAQATDLAALAVQHFPGTALPNSLLRELSRLYRLAGEDAPLTYELAADIFMGTFSPVFLRAAQEAATVVGGTLYARYYDIDYDAVGRMATPTGGSRTVRRTVPEFDALALARAGVDSVGLRSGAATNGRVIEQAQILTTQNLAAVVLRGLQVDPIVQARGSWATTKAHLAKAADDGGLRHRKNAAYAWRQMIFFLSLATPDAAAAFVGGAAIDRLPAAEAQRAAGLLEGLAQAVRGSSPSSGPFLGWIDPVDRRDPEQQ